MRHPFRYSWNCLLHVSSDMDSARLLGGLFFVHDSCTFPRTSRSRPPIPVQNLYETARKLMIGSAFRSLFDSASVEPSAALIVTVEVVFSGM